MLELRSVDAGYGSFQALFGVSLDVKAGEAVGVIGPNGAGKTTLMRVISGLIRPTKGTIAMEGTDVLATPPHRIVSLGIAHVPENRRLFPRLTVDDNLKMGAFMPGARAKFAERLEFVFDLFPRMKERRSQMAGTLSGGEQQMCAIGRALMSHPKLLLLDEPSAGLAPVVVQQVFELVKRIRASGLTVLIVEQNVQQVLRVVDRAYLLEAGSIRASGTSEEMLKSDTIKQAVHILGGFEDHGQRMQAFIDAFDIYLLEAVINGILLGGVLALLALGLNLIFGVIDVTWICYAELVMIGMYGMYYMVQVFGLPYWAAAPFAILLVAALGALLHYLVIAPLLTAPPINQLLATGGVLFILQSFATVAFGIDFRNLGIRLPVLAFGEMHFSYSRLLSFIAALVGMVAVYLFMTRTYTGTAIRAISQDRQIMSLMGVDTKRIYLITSALGGALAGLAACLLVLQYDVHPFVGLSFGPITFLICVLGGLGNFVGGFIAAFVFAEIISLGGLFSDLEWGYVLAFAFFIVMMFIRPAGLFARRS